MTSPADNIPAGEWPPEFETACAIFLDRGDRLGCGHPDTVAACWRALALAPDWARREIEQVANRMRSLTTTTRH